MEFNIQSKEYSSNINGYIIFYHCREENDDFSVLETQKDIDLPVVFQGTICHFGKHVCFLVVNVCSI